MSGNRSNPRSQLEARLQTGQFVVTGEVVPPRVPSFSEIEPKLRKLMDHVCAINVTDNASANVNMCSLALSVHLLRLGQDPVFQVTCRDRNRLAIQSDLIGALAAGIRNVLVVTGDFITLGDHPMALPVFDMDSIHVIQMLDRMRREGLMASGVPLSDSLKEPPLRPRFFLGAAANPFGHPLSMHVLKLRKKVLAGADFVQTQCIFDIERMKDFMDAVSEHGVHEQIHLLGGVMPVKSHRALEFMRDNVPGMSVSKELIRRMKSASDPRDEGLQIAAETIQQLQEIPGIAGVHITSHSWTAAVAEVVARAGLSEAISAHTEVPASSPATLAHVY